MPRDLVGLQAPAGILERPLVCDKLTTMAVSNSRQNVRWSRKISVMTYWIYINNIHLYARIHRSTCPHCNDGRGTHNATDSYSGRWEEAATYSRARARGQTTRYRLSDCAVCAPP